MEFDMTRPKIGIFGALAALGGVLAWRWAHKRRVAQTHLNRDLSRWEGEGGSPLSTVVQAAPSTSVATPAPNGTNGTNGVEGRPDTWSFPHS
jgi:hypothetical protein